MENDEAQSRLSRKSDHSQERGRSGGPAYKPVAEKAVYKETDYKIQTQPSVSTTVVGETVTYTQHFHF